MQIKNLVILCTGLVPFEIDQHRYASLAFVCIILPCGPGGPAGPARPGGPVNNMNIDY